MNDILTTEGKLTPMQMAKDLVYLEELQKSVKAKIDNYRMQLLEATQQLGVLTLKTDEYTISRAKRETIVVLDKKTLARELDSMGHEVIMSIDMDYMKPLVKKLAGQLSSVELKTTEYITVRTPKKDEV